jgi:hypothetical protein
MYLEGDVLRHIKYVSEILSPRGNWCVLKLGEWTGDADFLDSKFSPDFQPLVTQGTSFSMPLVAPIGNVTNLYNAHLKAGVVSAAGTPTGAGETASPNLPQSMQRR